MKSAVELIRAAGGTVAQAFCLIELEDLKGKLALPEGTPYFSVLEF